MANIGRIDIIKISSPVSSNYLQFGQSISMWGNYIAIGAALDRNNAAVRTGAVYLYEKDGTYVRKIVPSDGVVNGYFGISVCLFEDYLIVGSHGKNNRAGCIYLYKISDTSFEDIETFTAVANSYFGWRVKIYNGTIIASAPYSENTEGRVCVYSYDSLGMTFSHQIIASDATWGDRFGYAIDLLDDNIIVTAPSQEYPEPNPSEDTIWIDPYTFYEGPNPRAYLYKVSDNTYERIIYPSSFSYDSKFGQSCATYGDTILVGEPRARDYENRAMGALNFFSISDSSYSKKIFDTFNVSSGPLSSSYFSYRLSVTADYIFVGDTQYNSNGNIVGCVAIFDYNEKLLGRITTDQVSNNSEFSYGLCSYGPYIGITAPLDSYSDYTNIGSAFVLRMDGDTSFPTETTTLQMIDYYKGLGGQSSDE